jgi:hypothetical protein
MSSAVFCKTCKVAVEFPDGLYTNTTEVKVLARCPKCDKVLAFCGPSMVRMGPGAHEEWLKITKKESNETQ